MSPARRRWWRTLTKLATVAERPPQISSSDNGASQLRRRCPMILPGVGSASILREERSCWPRTSCQQDSFSPRGFASHPSERLRHPSGAAISAAVRQPPERCNSDTNSCAASIARRVQRPRHSEQGLRAFREPLGPPVRSSIPSSHQDRDQRKGFHHAEYNVDSLQQVVHDPRDRTHRRHLLVNGRPRESRRPHLEIRPRGYRSRLRRRRIGTALSPPSRTQARGPGSTGCMMPSSRQVSSTLE